MKIHELTIQKKASAKRIGRGIGSGTGKTAGRGTKGQNSRTGGGVRPGFEGGQNPLAKRLPKKRGFRAINHIDYAVLSLAKLASLKAGAVTNESLLQAGVVDSIHTPVKVLGTGELSGKFAVKLQAATKTAKAAIEKAGGTFEATSLEKSPKKPSKRNRKS